MAAKFKILTLIYPNFNTLDVNGPLEVFANGAIASSNLFSTSIASATEWTMAAEKVTIRRDVSFEDLLQEKSSVLSDCDILIVPGGPQAAVHAVIDSARRGDGGGGGDDDDHGLIGVIRKFVHLSSLGSRQRWLVSICTGAGFLAAARLIDGKTITTHWAYVERLQQLSVNLATESGGSPANVIRKRWVDGGEITKDVRLVTAGGVSCGIDCSLWIVSEVEGVEVAKKIAMWMDYAWVYSEIPVSVGYVLSGEGLDE